MTHCAVCGELLGSSTANHFSEGGRPGPVNEHGYFPHVFKGCTGIAASWCPVHGDCSCPRTEDGEVLWHFEPGWVAVAGHPAWSETARSVVDHDPACPLHGAESVHGDDG